MAKVGDCCGLDKKEGVVIVCLGCADGGNDVWHLGGCYVCDYGEIF